MSDDSVAEAAAIPAGPTAWPSGRLLSVDALRGFAMIWILGVDEWIAALASTYRNSLTVGLAAQMTHSNWEGLTFYDLVFPLLLFIAGVSLAFSLSRITNQKGRTAALRRVAVRSVLLFLLGVIYYGGFAKTFSDIRLLGVLQRIALCYLFAGLLLVLCKARWLAVAFVALLVGYWAIMALVPVPGIGAGIYEPGQNLANYVDSQYLPLFKWNVTWDPEGLLSTLPAIGTCLLGTLAGLFLKNEAVSAQRKVYWLCGAGVVGGFLGLLWSLQFPIVKQIWTSSYVLVAGGFCLLMLALFYQVIEIWRRRAWAAPLLWIGSNAITLYMLFGWPNSPLRGGLFSFHDLADRLVGGSLKAVVFGQAGNLAAATAVVGLVLCLAYTLYRKRIFIRL